MSFGSRATNPKPSYLCSLSSTLSVHFLHLIVLNSILNNKTLHKLQEDVHIYNKQSTFLIQIKPKGYRKTEILILNWKVTNKTY